MLTSKPCCRLIFTMFSVPGPPGNATTRSGFPSSNICWLRRYPADLPYLSHSAGNSRHFMSYSRAYLPAIESAPAAAPWMMTSGLIRSSVCCNAVHPLNFRPPHTRTLTFRPSAISHDSIIISSPSSQPRTLTTMPAFISGVSVMHRAPAIFHVYLHGSPEGGELEADDCVAFSFSLNAQIVSHCSNHGVPGVFFGCHLLMPSSVYSQGGRAVPLHPKARPPRSFVPAGGGSAGFSFYSLTWTFRSVSATPSISPGRKQHMWPPSSWGGPPSRKRVSPGCFTRKSAVKWTAARSIGLFRNMNVCVPEEGWLGVLYQPLSATLHRLQVFREPGQRPLGVVTAYALQLAVPDVGSVLDGVSVDHLGFRPWAPPDGDRSPGDTR